MKTMVINSKKLGDVIVKYDDADDHLISGLTWTANYNQGIIYIKHRYRIKGTKMIKSILMHRAIMNVTQSSIFVDHKNGDGTDNRRENLRICNHQQNIRNRKLPKNNTSGFKGVKKTFHNDMVYYRAVITFNGKRISLGSYKTVELAVSAYNDGAKKYHGEFASPN